MHIKEIIKRAELYCYIKKLRSLKSPETALDYLVKEKYVFHFRKAWGELKTIQNG